MFKNVASQKLIVYAFDSTTNLPKTGDAANLTAYVSKDFGSVTVLGDTSATEMDSTDAKGYYLFDLTQTETNADTLLFSAKSSTSNIVVIAVPAVTYTTPANFSTTSIDSNGRVDVIKIAGTTQTAGDIYTRLGAPAGASMSADIAAVKTQTAAIETDTQDIQSRIPAALVSGRIDASVGAMAANTLTASALASDAVTEIQSGLATAAALATVDQNVDDILEDTGTTLPSTLSTIAGYIDTEVAAIKAKTDNLPASPAATGDIPASDIAAIKAKTDNLPASPAATGDIPASDITAIKAKTDSLTFTVAGQVDSNIQYVNDVAVQGDGGTGTEWGPA